MSSPTVWCPSCGDEYVAGSQFCSDCHVALTAERPEATAGPEPTGPGPSPPAGGLPAGYEELGAWPHLAAVMITRRLQDAGIEVAALWSDPANARRSVLAVPANQFEFADAVLREFPISDELPESSVEAYLDRIEVRLAEVAILMDELRELGAPRDPRHTSGRRHDDPLGGP